MKKKICLGSLFLLCLLLDYYTTNAQVGGLYDAQGWAATTLGGKGGKIIRVSNLNASGSGSFTEALKVSGARIIVFEVGGVINLEGNNVGISNPYVTIAGQTAPSPGINVVNGTISIRTHDVIMQHIRVRPGASGHEISWAPDGPSCVSAHHVIIDHCSISWAVDENCSASGPRFEGTTPDEWRSNTSHDITMSNNIIAEGLNYATHIKGLHSMGSLIHDNVTNVAIIRNLYSSNNQRNPLFKAGAMGVVVNNYIYNPGSSGVRYGLVPSEWEGHDWITGRMSLIGNEMQLGPSSKEIPFMVATNSPCELYMDDNIAKNTMGYDLQQYKGDESNIVTSRPIWNDNIDLMTAAQTKDFVLNHAGARPWNRDEIDTRMINDVINDSGHMINFETDVEGYPDYAQTNVPFNTDEWNLDYMIRLAPEIEITMQGAKDTVYTDSVFIIHANIVGADFESNFIDLVVNGVQCGKKMHAPYTWELKADSVGAYVFNVVAEANDMNLWISSKLSVQAIEYSTGSSINRKLDPEDIVPMFNYPNPFYTSTTIDYSLPCFDNVNICVMNSMGQEIETLKNGKEHAGHHQLIWMPENVSAGTYFIVLISGSTVCCHKMIFGI